MKLLNSKFQIANLHLFDYAKIVFSFLNKKILSIIGFSVLIAAIPLTVFLSQQRQEVRQRASSSFLIGFNTAGIINYGACENTPYYQCQDLYPFSKKSDIDSDLAEIQRIGGKVVRVFASDKNVEATESARRLDEFLTKAANYNISTIVSLINLYGDNGFHPKGTDQYYTDSWGNISLLGDIFFESGYKNEYLNFVKTVVSYNRNHNNIYAWEPGNELRDTVNTQGFINFLNDVGSNIKSIDPNHPIATGMLNSAHTGLTPQTLYPNLSNYNIITIHAYNGDQSGTPDIDWASQNGKIAILEEGGIGGTYDRTASIGNQIQYWKSKNASLYMQWGFIAKGIGNTVDGDDNFGMDTIWHCADYNGLFNMYQTFSGVPTTTPSPLPSSCSVPSPTPGAPSSKIYIDPSTINGIGSNAVVTATGTLSCSTNISGPESFGQGLSNCNITGGFTCSTTVAKNPKDSNPCWWQWTCSTVNTGTYTATFTANNNTQCSSSNNYTVALGSTPTASPTPIVNSFSSYPRPKFDTGIGMHWSADASYAYDSTTAVNQICNLKKMGLSWIKIVATGTSAVDFARIMKQNDIEPIVRLYRYQPNPVNVPPTDLNAVSTYVNAGVSYFEPTNEPNLAVEWQGQVLPVCTDAASQTMQTWVVDALRIQQRGGIPLFPALSPGGNCDDMQFFQNSFNWLSQNTCYLANGTRGSCLGLFDSSLSNGKPAAIAVHNYNLNHDNSTNPDGTINFYTQDGNAFLKFTFYNNFVKSYLGKSIPILATEGGMIIGSSEDNRYPVTDAIWHMNVIMAMNNYQMKNTTPYFFNTAYWLSIPNRDATWGDGAWFNIDFTPKLTQTINVMQSMQKQSKNGTQYTSACTATTSTPTPSLTSTLTPSPSPIPTLTPSGTRLNLNLKLSGIGSGNGENPNPIHINRTATVCLYDPKIDSTGDNSCSKAILKQTGPVAYNQTTGNFVNNNFDLGVFNNPGQYQVLVKVDNYLRKRVPYLINIASNQTNSLPLITLTAGDIKIDNLLNIIDYNIYISCFGNKSSTPICIDKTGADLNDDGKNDTSTDTGDFKILFNSLQTRTGD